MSKPVFEDLFTASGRRNRKSYILYSLASGALIVMIVLVAVALAGDAGLTIATIAILPISLSSWLVGAQRCRDIGRTGWIILLMLLPLVNILFTVALWVMPGTKGENLYGEDLLAN